MEPQTEQPVHSPARSDRSSDSEGRPVREKLKETRIDAKSSSDPPTNSDQPMNDTSTNGAHGDNTSGSDSDRGRLRRKRSREAFEGDEAKTQGKKYERHTRKKSRDVTSPVNSDIESAKPVKTVKTIIPPISEFDGDATMRTATTEAREDTPEASDKRSRIASPKNKRTREQAESLTAAATEVSDDASTKTEEERTTKRLRDRVGSLAEGTKQKTQIPLGSGFANTSTTSPFATMSPQKPAPKPAGISAKDAPQTSSQAFKNSGFGSFASSAASPFGAAASSISSPFTVAAGSKISSFASSSSTPAAKPTGFASLGGSSGPSAFGGSANGSTSVFGGSLGTSAFGGIKPSSTKVSSFGSGATITGLTQKPVDFGSKEEPKVVDDGTTSDNDEAGEGNEDGTSQDPERKSGSSLLQSPGPIETGEENEDTAWVGRAKLYTLAGEAGKKAWQERGLGSFKLNVTREEPIRARFVLRAEGTHRLLLNAAVSKGLRFGDADGKEPKDGKILFTAPTTSGEVESHLLRLKAERAIELWSIVEEFKKSSLQ
ncbi:hypothetical protein P280DRAFT_108668 [Massarina eburnea CBS 473.64]|uniref:RanBD1 domain-containing protein n=1 Tax=Massarina eburnea CBS 473.64 TaxID=1395130 RepID=A0A6A6RT48_9PLEO|nr:hypothetical protein P280DRAFT_108668 [Massarina eburnea CBS 473.64]